VIEDFLLFRDVAENRNFTRAAELHGVSQAAVSQRVKAIEDRLHVKLIDRSRRPFDLTAAGETYLRLCQDMTRRYEAFERDLRRLKRAKHEPVRMAAIYSIGLSEMVSLQLELRRRHPQSRLVVEYLRPDRVYDAVALGEADLGLVSYPRQERGLEVIAWREEEMELAVKPNHPLARHAYATPEQLKNREFVAFDEDLPIHRHIHQYLAQRGATVNEVLHLDNVDSVREAVSQGVGVAIIPSVAIRQWQDRLTGIPLRPGLRRPLGIIRRAGPPSETVKTLLELLLRNHGALRLQ
jgi:DNA-binding transcriptional LysR family regulator